MGECFDDERDAVVSVDDTSGLEIFRVRNEGIDGVVVNETENEDFSLVDGASDSGVASDFFLYEGEAGFEDFGVVEKEDVVGEKDVGEVGEVFVVVGVGVAVWLAYEETGIVVGECGRLGDEVFGEVNPNGSRFGDPFFCSFLPDLPPLPPPPSRPWACWDMESSLRQAARSVRHPELLLPEDSA